MGRSSEIRKVTDGAAAAVRRWWNGVLLGFSLVGGFSLPTFGHVGSDLCEMDVEDLTRVHVTSVSKHEESRFSAGAAVYVLSNEDLRRNGFLTVADSLRLVPGVTVGQINAHTWTVSARGFNGEYATKLLVLNDGRSAYTPLSSSVYWDTQDFMLDDIERIEIVRGPGATLWGENAVNGVINIITRHTRDTQGLLVTGGAGSHERGFGAIRYGGALGANAWYRVYIKQADHDNMVFADGSDARDDWRMARTGFRIDWEPAEVNQVTVQGDYYQGSEGHYLTQATPAAPFATTQTLDSDVTGGNLLGRWTQQQDDGAELKVQAYYDQTRRESNLPREQRDTFDLEWQHSFWALENHQLTWGLGYRVSADRIAGDYGQSFVPGERTVELFSAFVQDELVVLPDRLNFRLGSKFEHNDFTGVEFQPGGRLVWTPTLNQTAWAAISRAVRTPNRAEDDVRVNRPTGAPVPLTIVGNAGGVSEELIAYELGYRVLPHPRVSLDIATFYNDYEHLRSIEPLAASTFYSANTLKGETYGIELAGEWQVLDCWRLRAAYTCMRGSLHLRAGGTDVVTERQIEGSIPQQQFSLRSAAELGHNVEFSWGVRYVDQLRDPFGPGIPAYLTMDARLAWWPAEQLEISLVGLNLLDGRHPEFGSAVVATPTREVERSFYAKITWRF